ncbi:Nadph-cytochrome p450 [Globisporangium polare]
MPMSVAPSCQSADMTVQRVQQQQEPFPPQQDVTMSAPIRTVRRFTSTTMPTISAPLIPHSTEQSHQQQQQQPEPHRRTRKRLSLPFRRTSQVFASTITDVDVYYGSLTGTSARLAALLAKEIAARGVNTTLQSLEHFDEHVFVASDKLASTHASVFVVATHFAGSASPSAELFYEWLKAASSSSSSNGMTVAQVHCSSLAKALASMGLNDGSTALESALDVSTDTATDTTTVASTVPPPDSTPVGSSPLRFLLNWGRDLGRKRPRDRIRSRLEGLQYAVFGVGSSEYLTFNAVGKFVDARLHILGGARLSALGLGDMTGDAEAAFLKWRVEFLQQLPVIPHNIRLLAFENDLLLMEPQRKADPQQLRHQRLQSGSFSRSAQQYRQQNDSTQYSHANPGAATVKSMVVDRYNKPVRLRFRCRAIAAPVVASRRSSVSTQQKQVPMETSVVTKHSLHTRRPNVSLQSIKLLQQGATGSSGGANEKRSLPATNPLDVHRSQVALLRIALLDPDMKYEAADTFGYLPHNSTENVERIAASLGFDLDTWIELYFDRHLHEHQQRLHQNPNQLPFLTPCTVRTALSEFLELNTVTREFLRVASGFVSNDSERDLLEQLASTDGSAAFTDQFVKQNKGILQLLDLAPSLKIPFEVFVNITPVIKPRLYSIACSPQRNPREIELGVNLGRPAEKHGVSVAFLRKLTLTLLGSNNNNRSTGVMLRAFIVRSLFRVPSDMTSPMIMIANGIGIAPMRALLQHRRLEYDKLSGGKTQPRNLLFYGCRDASSIIFEDELRALEAEGFLTLSSPACLATLESLSMG